jgi:EAL domain-containing protein (putative c-di-GMP-specific phosphodiesterase class I)
VGLKNNISQQVVMRTETIDCRTGTGCWVEYTPAGATQSVRTDLTEFPFTIGRGESADLRIESSRVSREHAAIECVDRRYLVRDLNSTNGTFINGQPVRESPLEDGDMIRVADIELTFGIRASGRSRGAATMVMQGSGAELAEEGGRGADLVAAVRRMQQRVVHCAVDNRYRPVVHLQSGKVFGYEALLPGRDSSFESSPAEKHFMASDCRLATRVHQLARVVAVEEAAGLLGESRLLVQLDANELGSVDLEDSLGKLRALCGPSMRLVVEIPDSAACKTPQFIDFFHRIRQWGIAIAFEGFAAGKAHVIDRKELPPDFIILAPSVVRGLDRSDDRQQQLQDVTRTCLGLGCEVVADGVRSEKEAQLCRQLGCRYGLGELFGKPISIDSLPDSTSGKRPRGAPAARPA